MAGKKRRSIKDELAEAGSHLWEAGKQTADAAARRAGELVDRGAAQAEKKIETFRASRASGKARAKEKEVQSAAKLVRTQRRASAAASTAQVDRDQSAKGGKGGGRKQESGTTPRPRFETENAKPGAKRGNKAAVKQGQAGPVARRRAGK